MYPLAIILKYMYLHYKNIFTAIIMGCGHHFLMMTVNLKY